MPHTSMAYFPCKEGVGTELLSVLLVALADTRAFEGNVSIETYVDQDNPDRIFLWEKWETRENYEAYLAWRMETGMMDMLGPLLDGSPEFIHLGAQD
ncbi:MAG TPA: antibiotic biosynthesis monooxygenase [Acidimicrobiales bacterium]|nr:antibiotic biosynthesis monooxygenase [Acidimicrobiales bacterium]